MPTLSVVTICFNNFDDVLATCASVDAQTVKPDEHWIINGSTEPATAEWLENTPQPSYRRWAHVENQHIAGNFSQGIPRVNCDFIHLLNSGDLYAENDVLEKVLQFLQQHPKVQWISGKLRTQRGGHMVEIGKPFERSKLYRGMRSVSHPTWFVRKEVHDRVGLYNRAYRIAMDYDMMCRIADEPYGFIDLTITYFDNTGISSVKYLDSLKENIKAYESHFGYSVKCRLWQMRLKTLHLLLQTGFGQALFNLKKKIGLENW
jgi:hypothetical protein